MLTVVPKARQRVLVLPLLSARSEWRACPDLVLVCGGLGDRARRFEVGTAR